MTAARDDFWSHVDRTSRDGCWPWLLARGRGRNAYGRLVGPEGKVVRAHRMALELAAGPAPANRPWALHHCDNPSCCRPDHLYWGTAKDNARDMTDRLRRNPATAARQPNFINETGNRYGSLVVATHSKNAKGRLVWLCRCDCGGKFLASPISLRSGGTTSCGCRGFFLAAGDRFGRLVVQQWVCGERARLVCDCGNAVDAHPSDLRNGHVRSCGCLRTEMLHAKGPVLKAFGAEHRRIQWAIWAGLRPETLRSRLRRGWEPERALTTPERHCV